MRFFELVPMLMAIAMAMIQMCNASVVTFVVQFALILVLSILGIDLFERPVTEDG